MTSIHFADKYLLNPYHPISVMVVGAGGTGSQVVQNLARMNCALRQLGHKGLHVILVDDDIVTEYNLGRQLFTENEIGLNKAVCIATRINRFFGFGWEGIIGRYPNDISRTANITITCVDNVKSRLEIGKFLANTKTNHDECKPMYWMDFGNAQYTGQIILGSIKDVPQPKSSKYKTVGKLPCVDEEYDLQSVDEAESGPSCSMAEALRKQDLFVNSTLANIGCCMLWHLISGGSVEQRGAYMNLSSMNVRPIPIK